MQICKEKKYKKHKKYKKNELYKNINIKSTKSTKKMNLWGVLYFIVFVAGTYKIIFMDSFS